MTFICYTLNKNMEYLYIKKCKKKYNVSVSSNNEHKNCSITEFASDMYFKIEFRSLKKHSVCTAYTFGFRYSISSFFVNVELIFERKARAVYRFKCFQNIFYIFLADTTFNGLIVKFFAIL